MSSGGDACDATLATNAPHLRIASFDYLRGFTVLLVVLHHTVLAYATFAFLNPYDPTSTFSPIVDGARWVGFDHAVKINDTFLMPLLFFISGLFVWPILQTKAAGSFVRRRLVRLGIPLLVGVTVLIPVAYYPTILEIELVFGKGQSFREFYIDFAARGFGPPGPLWFVGLLLILDCLAALLYVVLPKSKGASIERKVVVLDNAVMFALMLLGLTLVTYLVMTALIDPGQWIAIGPFSVQIARLFLYLVFFASGVAIGARGVERSAFRGNGGFAKRWWAWVLAGVLAYAGLGASSALFGKSMLTNAAFAAAAAFMVLGVISLFVRFARRHVLALDGLSANSYGIYILHYTVVIWLQYAVLRVPLPAVVKATVVFLFSVSICWGLAAALRRIKVVEDII